MYTMGVYEGGGGACRVNTALGKLLERSAMFFCSLLYKRQEAEQTVLILEIGKKLTSRNFVTNGHL